jgi:hypothetical protein
MIGKRKLAMFAATGALVVATAVAGVLAAPQTTSASSIAAPVTHWGGPGVAGAEGGTYLAEALGITAEELAAAQEEARVAAIDLALEKGLITQAQADALKANDRSLGRGMIPFLKGDATAEIDPQALLADALGITVEQLQEATQKAADLRLEQAVEDGRITQEQADLMKAEQALRSYIEEKGFYAEAVAQAVEDGVITQAQADAILSQQGRGFWGGPRMDDFGRGGHGRRGGFGPGVAPNAPDAPAQQSVPSGQNGGSGA